MSEGQEKPKGRGKLIGCYPKAESLKKFKELQERMVKAAEERGDEPPTMKDILEYLIDNAGEEIVIRHKTQVVNTEG